jgi:DNA-binding NtrC family response regulator
VQTPVRVLYVDDSPFDRALVRDALEQEDGSFQVIEAASRAEFFARLVEGGYDLVLSDFNILGFEGLQVIDAVQTQEPGIPVVIVTGTGSEEIAVAALKRGAADYVIKTPQHIQRLPLTIQAVLERTRLEAERLRQDRQLRYQAEQITQIMRSVPDGVLLLNSENRILLANPTAQAMLVQLGGAQPGDTLTRTGRPSSG